MSRPPSSDPSRADLQATAQIPADAEAPRSARAFLRAHLPDNLDAERLRDLEVIVTELTANAVQHGSSPGDEIKLALEPRGRTFYVSVTDRCRKRTSPALFASSSDRESGRGLLTIDRLAAQWGDEIVRGERRVWATVNV